MKSFYNKYLLPGLVFQSIVVGGGYGTGREMVTFFMDKGPMDGYWGMLLAMGIWSLVMAIGFELARQERLYDYRSMLKFMLGKGWVLFEIIFIATMILVIAVMGAASGELMHEILGCPQYVGVLLLFILVGFLVFKGSGLIERVFSVWSGILYLTYFIVIAMAFSQFGDRILEQVTIREGGLDWLKGGFQYAAYNVAVLPAILFVTRHFETRREAVIAGLLSGPLAMIPAILIYTAMLSFYPEVLAEALPANFLINQLDNPAFLLFFQFVLFGTFIETGTGLIHGFNERVASVYREKEQEMPARLRLGIGLGIMLLAIVIANALGLIALIAQGYGYITWAFWIIFLLPLLVLGPLKLAKKGKP